MITIVHQPYRQLSMNSFIAIFAGIILALSASKSYGDTLHFPDAATARFSVDVVGQGPDVILVPGLGSSKATRDGTVAHLKNHYRLHVINLAGFAGEPAAGNAEGAVLAPTVEALHVYMTSHHLKPIYFGHSLSGVIGLMLAKAYPQDETSLVIVDALPWYGMIFAPQSNAATIELGAAQMRDGMMSASDDAFAANSIQSAVMLVSAPTDQATISSWSRSSDRKVFAKAFYEDLTTDLREDLSNIKTTVVLFYPFKASASFSLDQVDAFYKGAYAAMPNVRL